MFDKIRSDNEIPGFTPQSREACVSLDEREVGMLSRVTPRRAYPKAGVCEIDSHDELGVPGKRKRDRAPPAPQVDGPDPGRIPAEVEHFPDSVTVETALRVPQVSATPAEVPARLVITAVDWTGSAQSTLPSPGRVSYRADPPAHVASAPSRDRSASPESVRSAARSSLSSAGKAASRACRSWCASSRSGLPNRTRAENPRLGRDAQRGQAS